MGGRRLEVTERDHRRPSRVRLLRAAAHRAHAARAGAVDRRELPVRARRSTRRRCRRPRARRWSSDPAVAGGAWTGAGGRVPRRRSPPRTVTLRDKRARARAGRARSPRADAERALDGARVRGAPAGGAPRGAGAELAARPRARGRPHRGGGARSSGTTASPRRCGRTGRRACPTTPRSAAAATVRAAFTGLGLHEAVTLPLGPRTSERCVRVLNPLSQEEAFLRAALLPGLVRRVEHNWRLCERDVRLFEIGHVFARAEGPASPRRRSGWRGWSRAARRPHHWSEPAPPDVDLFDAKALVEAAVAVACPGAAVARRRGPAGRPRRGRRGVGLGGPARRGRPAWAGAALRLRDAPRGRRRGAGARWCRGRASRPPTATSRWCSPRRLAGGGGRGGAARGRRAAAGAVLGVRRVPRRAAGRRPAERRVAAGLPRGRPYPPRERRWMRPSRVP